MVFPRKKRIEKANNEATASSSTGGLDLLSAASHCVFESSAPVTTSYRASRSASFVSNTSTVDFLESWANEIDGSPTKPNHDILISNAPSSISAYNPSKTFPQTLMDMLDCTDHATIVSWLPDGKSFCIHKPTKFASLVLPNYFRKTHFNSFIRKLNRWGFRRIKNCNDPGETPFAHKLFVRGEPELCNKMSCKSKPTKKHAAPKNKKAVEPSVVQSLQARDVQQSVGNKSQVSASSLTLETQMQGRGLIQNQNLNLNLVALNASRQQQAPFLSSHYLIPAHHNATITRSELELYESQLLLRRMQERVRFRMQLLGSVPSSDLELASQVFARRQMQLELSALESQRSRGALWVNTGNPL